MRGLQRGPQLGNDPIGRGGDQVGIDPDLVDLDTVEARRELPEGGVAAGANRVDDGADLFDGRFLGRLGPREDRTERMAIRGVGAAQIERRQGSGHGERLPAP